MRLSGLRPDAVLSELDSDLRVAFEATCRTAGIRPTNGDWTGVGWVRSWVLAMAIRSRVDRLERIAPKKRGARAKAIHATAVAFGLSEHGIKSRLYRDVHDRTEHRRKLQSESHAAAQVRERSSQSNRSPRSAQC